MYIKKTSIAFKHLCTIQIILLLLFSTVLFTACNSSSTPNAKTTDEPTMSVVEPITEKDLDNQQDSSDKMQDPTIEEPVVEEELAVLEELEVTIENLTVGELATLGDWEIVLNSFEITDSIDMSYGSFKPDEGNQYVSVNLTVKNIATTADTFLPLYAFGNKDVVAKIMYQGKYEYTASNLIGYDDDLHGDMLNPLSSLTGVIAFSIIEEAANSSELTLVLSLGKEEIVFDLQ